MWDLKACTVCLSTDVKLYNINDQLRHDFNLVAGLKRRQGDGLPNYLCVECEAYIKKFVLFRGKCRRADFTLHELRNRNKEITKASLKSLDREVIGIMPYLSFLDDNRVCYQESKFQWLNYNRPGPKYTEIPILQYATVKCDAVNNSETVVKKESFVSEGEPKDNNLNVENLLDQSTSVNIDASNIDSLFDSCNFDGDDDNRDEKTYKVESTSETSEADGSKLDQEYASMVPISENEAKAAKEICSMHSIGKYRCGFCNRGYNNESRLTVHMRMHDKYVSGIYHCEFCDYYYKTEHLLKIHLTDKHMYKYLCKKCPEVNFDRLSAKQHYICMHLKKFGKREADWCKNRPKWLSSKGGKRVKGIVSIKPTRKLKKLPADFLVYSPVGHTEQYTIIQDRQKSRNYIEAKFKCELCFRGFREVGTYKKHMQKHDPAVSGPLQCDMCKVFFRNARSMYKHMIITHLFKYSCRDCAFVCYNRGQAHMHYKFHKNVTYSCPHCDMEFKKLSTRLTHIRIKHPSTYICNICGRSFVSEAGLCCHRNLAHKEEEAGGSPRAPDPEDPLYCADCNVQFLNADAFQTHLGSSNKHADINFSSKRARAAGGRGGGGAGGARGAAGGGAEEAGGARKRGRPARGVQPSEVLNNGAITASHCELCGQYLANDVQARKHYEAEHPGHDFLKRYMCDVCGHATKQYANLLVHMRTHTREKPYGCPHCDRRFSMTSNRDRHLVVHTGEKRYQCQHCNRRFTQSSAVKLHIQTVHLKIPYAPWDKKNRKRRKQADALACDAAPAQPAPPAPAAPAAPAPAALPDLVFGQPKLMLDTQGDYLNAYITYSDE